MKSTDNILPIDLTVLDSFYVDFQVFTGIAFLFKKKKSQSQLENLKSSFEKATKVFYPYTGRFIESTKEKGSYVISFDGNESSTSFELREDNEHDFDFDSEGAEYRIRNNGFSDKYYPHDRKKANNSNYLISTRVTNFSKGGCLITLRLHHGIGDGRTCFSFLECWWALSRGEEYINELHFDRSLMKSVMSEDIQEPQPFTVSEEEVNVEEFNCLPEGCPKILSVYPWCRKKIAVLFPPQEGLVFCNWVFEITEETLSHYHTLSQKNNERLSNNDILTAMILKSYAVSFQGENEILSMSYLVNLRGKRKKKVIPKGYIGNALTGGRISENKTLFQNSSILDLALIVRKETNRALQEDEIENFIDYFCINAEKKDHLLWNMDNKYIITNWCGFPFYEKVFTSNNSSNNSNNNSNQIDTNDDEDEDNSPFISGPDFPFMDLTECFKVVSARESKGVWVYMRLLESNVNFDLFKETFLSFQKF